MPILHTFLDPEEAQKLAINLLSTGYMPKDMGVDDQLLATEVSRSTLSHFTFTSKGSICSLSLSSYPSHIFPSKAIRKETL